MSFPPAFLEELRARLPLSSVVGKKVRLIRAGREMKGCCPFHNEKSPSFYVNDDKQFFHCFGCGASGDIIGFTMRHDKLNFLEAIEDLAGQAGLVVPQNTPVNREQFDSEKRLYQLSETACAWFEEQLYAPHGREALAYLHGRGLSDAAIKRHRLGFAPNDGQALIRKLSHDKYTLDEMATLGLIRKAENRPEHYSFFRNRVLFPVGDRKGRIIAFGGRVMGEGEPKYLNSPDHPLFHKGKLLYGLSRAKGAIGQGQPLIVVEGYMDVIALVEAGFTGAVAPLGTALTEDQMAALWQLLPSAESRDATRDYSPILCFDGDNAGLRAAARAMERALPLLIPTQTFRIATMVGAKDPDELIRQAGKSAMQALLDQAKPMIDAVWDMTLLGRHIRTPEERGAFSAAIKQRVSRIANEDMRRLYQDAIQKRLNDAFQTPRFAGAQSGSFQKTFVKGKFQNNIPPPFLSRKNPMNPHRLRERALLALMINHPALFGEFGEDMAHHGFDSPELETLRQRVVEILSMESDVSLDAAELYRHITLSDASLTRILTTEILTEATYIHVGMARPDRTLEQARHGWQSIWKTHQQEKLRHDLDKARRHYAEDSTDASYARLMAIQQQVMNLVAHEPDELDAETDHTLAHTSHDA